jgi:hypothetical protein
VLLLETTCCARTRSARRSQLIAGERCALAASSGLINAAPDEASKRFLATQTLDEARHVEVFTSGSDLGVGKGNSRASSARCQSELVKFAEILLEKVDRKDFVSGVVAEHRPRGAWPSACSR